MTSAFHRFIAEQYPLVRSKFPGEGRRKWRLRIMEDLWATSEALAEIASAALSTQTSSGDAGYENESDPLDHLTDGEEAGVLIRTDFSSDDGWSALVHRLQEAEKEFFASLTQESDGNPHGPDSVEMVDGGVESGSESENVPDHIITIISQPSDIFNGISNLVALRLLNDVGIRVTPSPPPGVSRIRPSNRLIDKGGLQEVYTGKTIWIYDEQSNVDDSVRLVSQQGDVYGTATGDSWRARISHIPELQFNMSYSGMKIDFGGLDRWDYSERTRNLNEAEGH